MYRRNNRCSCHKCMMNNNNSINAHIQHMMDNAKNDVLGDICDDVATLAESDNNDICKCGFDEPMAVFPENPTLAQSYVPYQYMNETFKPCVGLKMGTIFPELVSPYVPCQSIEEIEFIKATNKIGKGCNK